MPHIIIECSANVAEVTDPAELVRAVHDAAAATGVAPLDALRTRLLLHQHYLIADGREENRFVAIVARLAEGRPDEDRRRLVAALLDAVERHLGHAVEDTAISVEYQEIDPTARLNANRLQARIGGVP